MYLQIFAAALSIKSKIVNNPVSFSRWKVNQTMVCTVEYCLVINTDTCKTWMNHQRPTLHGKAYPNDSIEYFCNDKIIERDLWQRV